jgi:hypothetical protein
VFFLAWAPHNVSTPYQLGPPSLISSYRLPPLSDKPLNHSSIPSLHSTTLSTCHTSHPIHPLAIHFPPRHFHPSVGQSMALPMTVTRPTHHPLHNEQLPTPFNYVLFPFPHCSPIQTQSTQLFSVSKLTDTIYIVDKSH